MDKFMTSIGGYYENKIHMLCLIGYAHTDFYSADFFGN